VDIHVVVVVK